MTGASSGVGAAPVLRPYQLAAVSAVEALWASGSRAPLVEAATGSGKSVTMGALVLRAVEAGETVLFLAHRYELLEQFRAHLARVGVASGLERGSSRAGAEPVVVASVQTLRGERLAAFPRDAFDVVMIDECHHSPARSYREILAHFSTARVLGVTATTDRADGVALASVFDAVAHRFGIAEAVAGGFLVPIRGVSVEVPGLDLSSVRLRKQCAGGSRVRPGETVDLLAPAGQARVWALPNGSVRRAAVDFHPTDLGRAVATDAAVEGVVVPFLELAGDRKTVVFAVDRRHAAALVASVNAKRPGPDGGGIARVVHGGLRKKDRRETLAAFERGDFSVLVNVLLLTEGWDCPSVECVVMARPTQSRVLYSQAVGRALRLYAGKTHALLLDFVGVGSRFDLVGPEDCLGGALDGPVVRVSADPDAAGPELSDDAPVEDLGLAGLVGAWFSKRAARRDARDSLARAKTLVAAPARVSYSTRAVTLIRGAGLRARGWLGRLLGGKK